MAKLILNDLGELADLTLELSCALTDFADRYPPHHPVHAFARQTRILARDLTRDPDILIRGLRGKVPPLRDKHDPRDPYALRNLRATEGLHLTPEGHAAIAAAQGRDPMKKRKPHAPKTDGSVKKVCPHKGTKRSRRDKLDASKMTKKRP